MLEKQRQEIDQLDRELVALFEKRMAVVTEIGEIKKSQNLPIFDEAREDAVIQRAKKRLINSEYAPYIDEFFTDLMKTTKKFQQNLMK
ncbi:chorismate mutase [Carnobacterium gallinarum]|uniref:chorismate mutase n=1 Tax=Carnobacterium gallinarum TaxID=2749 RepID=UPI000556D95C|nr:chorismate mutase [Carnobacterium gallinarum]